MMNCANFFGIVTWEQRKLDDTITHKSGTSIEKYFSSKGLYKVISIGSYGSNGKYIDQGIRAAANEKTNSHLIKKGELSMVLNDKTGGKIIGRVLLIEKNNQYVVNQRSEIIKLSTSLWDPQFAFTYLNGPFRKKVLRIMQGGTQNYVNFSSVKKLTASLTSVKEQKEIGTLFQKLDNIIILQQRKLSLIEKLRENISEHIFSPDIMKFKNIDPEFEIKKLSDISNIFIGLVTTMTKNYAKNGILLIRNSNIKENNFKFDNYIYLDSKFAEKNKNREMKIGDVVTVHTGDIGTSAVIEPKEENSIGFATITTRPNNKIINSYYLSDYLNTKKHKNWAVRMSTGDGRRNYNLKDFTRIRLNVPSLNYQIKIVALIKYLESFSKSEKKKINQLNSLKQFLLQNLFI